MFRQRNDTVFQLSLTELAFVLAFVVLLLIGSKVFLIEVDRAACTEQRDNCVAQMPAIVGDPQQAIDSLINEPKLRAENKELKAKLAAKEAELSAAGILKTADQTQVATAVEFMRGYQETSKTPLSLNSAKEEGRQLHKGLDNCRGQLKHCVSGTKGYGLPPCWVDSAGRIEYLFEVEIGAAGTKVTKEWPTGRDEEAKSLGAHAIAERGEHSLPEFKQATSPIFEASRTANPECRHYVILKRDPALRDIDSFNTIRLGVEDHFYKLDRTGIVSR